MSTFIDRLRDFQLTPPADRKQVTVALIQARYYRYEVTGVREEVEHTLIIWAHSFSEIETWALGQLEQVTAMPLGYAEIGDDDIVLHD